jgi:drug/metabolite transporter (DMT)-like permease
MNLIGELAGLGTSFFFAMTALIFTATGRMVGSQVTNRMRLSIALLYLVILNTILFREPLPFSVDSSRWIWLSLSGIVGLSLGDAFLFQSFVSVGARLGTLLLSLAPIFGSLIAWLFFGEVLTAWQIAGIVLALAGIAWVVMSHKEPPKTPRGHTKRGVIFGALAGLGQAVGLVLSKQAMPSACWRLFYSSGLGPPWRAKPRQPLQPFGRNRRSSGCWPSARWWDLSWVCPLPCWQSSTRRWAWPAPSWRCRP